MKLADRHSKYGDAMFVHWAHVLAVLGAGVTYFLR